MKATMTIWHTLGIAPTHDKQALTLAYAARLKLVKPADGPGAVQALRTAYQQALAALTAASAASAPPDLPPLQPSRAPLSGLPPLPALPLDTPLAQPLALDLEAESDAALAQQHSQRWLPGPRPRSYARARPVLRPAPQAPAPAEAAEMICQALARLPASAHDVEIVRLYDQPGWGNFDFRDALEGALIKAVESHFEQRQHMVRALAQTLNWEQNGPHSPNAQAIAHLVARTRAREWISQFDTWPTSDPTLQAVWLLAGPVDRMRFNDFAKARKRLDAMHSLLQHLAEKSGYVVGHEINAASFQWWSANIVRLRGGRAAAPRAAQGKSIPATANGKPWKREVNFGLAIGIMLLMLIMISNAAKWIQNS